MSAPRVPAEALLDHEGPSRSGWLVKKGSAFPWGFRRRYFLFWKGSCRLSYFDSEEDAARKRLRELKNDMTDKEQRSLSRQLARCWGANRRAAAPVALHISSLGRCSACCLPENNDHLRWKVRRCDIHLSHCYLSLLWA